MNTGDDMSWLAVIMGGTIALIVAAALLANSALDGGTEVVYRALGL